MLFEFYNKLNAKNIRSLLNVTILAT